MKTYRIEAPRQMRALYYQWEYGTQRAVQFLRAEPHGVAMVRVPSGTAKRTYGLFLRKKQAERFLRRVLGMACEQAGRIGTSVRDIDQIFITKGE